MIRLAWINEPSFAAGIDQIVSFDPIKSRKLIKFNAPLIGGLFIWPAILKSIEKGNLSMIKMLIKHKVCVHLKSLEDGKWMEDHIIQHVTTQQQQDTNQENKNE